MRNLSLLAAILPLALLAQEPNPGTPPAFGTAPAAGPRITPATLAEAEKLVRVELSDAARAQMAESWATLMAPLAERRAGPRKVALGADLAPYSLWNPVLPGHRGLPVKDRFTLRRRDPGPLPEHDAAIAFAPVWKLSAWFRARRLTSERLTRIYLERIQRLDPRLRAVITPVTEQALAQAKQADRDLAAGRFRGPLQGIPYGVKDLLDTKGIPTTYGAEFCRTRIPTEDSAVVRRLAQGGAVLVAKLSLGSLALNDVWFGGQTLNPWLLEEGSGGSSAGPGAATAAGLVAFAIGSETEGSIIDPSMRCGVTGLRPTFGRVPRTGAMTLCWSLDKLGPIARSVEDTLLVLKAIQGPDPGDLCSVRVPLAYDAQAPVKGLKVGYFKGWMQEAPATDVDRAALEALRKLGLTPVEVTLPDWPYGALNAILFAEAAAAFEDETLDGRMDTLKVQTADAWPNVFRSSRFISAVDFVQADRLRRAYAKEMERIFATVDVLLVPSLRDEMMTIGNFTGHPSLTLRAGFVQVSEARSDWAPDPAHPLPRFDPPRRVPHGVTLLGRLFDEGTLGRVGLALEEALRVNEERPPGF